MKRKNTKLAEGIEGLTSTSMARGKDIKKQKFLVEIQEDLSEKLTSIADESGVSRNLLMNMLVSYFIDNKQQILSQILDN